MQALPAFLTGHVIARALDDGFLADNTAAGLAWLGVLAVAVLIGAWGTRQTFLRLAAVVEPFRDELTRASVDAALRHSVAPGAAADTAGVARISEQVEVVRDSYASVLLVVQGFAVTSVSAMLGLATLAPLVLVVVVPPLALGLALFGAALPGMAKRQRDLILADEGLAEGVTAAAHGLRDIAAGGGEERVAVAVGQHIDAQARATRELARFTALRTMAVALGGWLPIVLLLVAGPWLLDSGVTTGALLGAITYAQGVHGALEDLVRGLGNTGLWLLVTLRRVIEANRSVTPTISRHRPGRQEDVRGYHVALNEVTFGYGRSPEPVVHQLKLAIEEGEHLAIVGPSGIGKSTLGSLISGLLEPQAGAVHLGGAEVAGLEGPEAARHRALIPQEAYVFEGTVRENLSYLNESATAAELEHAVGELGIGELIERLGGYQAPLNPHALSDGERQLITLARAYASTASLVILDEATSQLDPAREARVEEAFARRPGSLIVIAHRISSALRADRILVMTGHTVAVGTHDELLARSPLYRDLVGHWRTETVAASVPAPQPETVKG